MNREPQLARTFVELADTLVETFDMVELLSLLADRCVELFDVEAAGLMLATAEGELRVMASSSEAMRVLELLQLQRDEGPCVDAYRTGQPVVEKDLATAADRWPLFAPEAVAAGFHSAQALPMRLRGTGIGALNLLRTSTGGMDTADVVVAQALADVATIAVVQHRAAVDAHRLNEQLQHALNSRIVIEQAKGVVAEQTQLDMQHAFEKLRAHARRHNLLLLDVARSVIDGVLTSDDLG